MVEIHKRGAANTMGVQNGDGLRPARAGSIRRGWQASRRHEGKEENPPGAEGTATVQKWREKQDRQGSGPPAREFQGRQQEGAWKEQMTGTAEGLGAGSRCQPCSSGGHWGDQPPGPLKVNVSGREMGRFPWLVLWESKFGGITAHFRTGKSKGFSVRINESHFFGNKVAVFWIPCQSRFGLRVCRWENQLLALSTFRCPSELLATPTGCQRPSVHFWLFPPGVCVQACLVTRSCPALCDPMDCSPPGSSVCGIFQARILEWDAISYSRGSSWPTVGTHGSCIGRWILHHWTTWEALPGMYHHVNYIGIYVLTYLLCLPRQAP